MLKDFPPNRKGGVRCDDLLRQNGADTARLAASSHLRKVLSAGDGAGEAATQLGRALARADRRQNNDRPTGLLKPKEVAAAFAKAGKFDPVAAARYEKARTDYKGEIGQVRDFIPGEVLARNRQGSPMWQATPEQVAAKFLAKQSSVEQLLKLFGIV